jgi:uncharacterized protein (TIGR02598 family)
MRTRIIGRQTGFSLVEVTLALAIMAIGLIAIIGMIPQGVQSSRGASDNTLVATIVHDTFNQMRLGALTGTGWPPSSQDVYYDTLATNIVTTLQDKYFHVVVTPLLSPSIPNLYIVTTTITWPDKSATSRPINTNVFVTQIANYQQ